MGSSNRWAAVGGAVAVLAGILSAGAAFGQLPNEEVTMFQSILVSMNGPPN